MGDTSSHRIVVAALVLVAMMRGAAAGDEPAAEPVLRANTGNPAPVATQPRFEVVTGTTAPRPRGTGTLARMAAAFPALRPPPTTTSARVAVLQPVDPVAPRPRGDVPAGAADGRGGPAASPARTTRPPVDGGASRVIADPDLRLAQHATQPVKPGAFVPDPRPPRAPQPESPPAERDSEPRRGPVANWLQAQRPTRETVVTATPLAASPLAVGSRLRERLRAAERTIAERLGARRSPVGSDGVPAGASPEPGGWPHPAMLHRQFEQLATGAADPVREWIDDTRTILDLVASTAGPDDALSLEPLALLAEAPAAGQRLADAAADPTVAAQVRRAALAVGRRAAVWQAAATLRHASATGDGDRREAETDRLLDALERYEASQSPLDAHVASESLAVLAAMTGDEPRLLATAAREHYAAPNLRIAVHRQLVERLLPESEIDRGVVDDMILGRQVRGRRTVERTAGVRFVPDPDELAFDLEVRGHVESRTVTESGPVALTSRGVSAFTVRKPVKLSAAGLVFGPASGVASNRSQLAGIETSFDSVPLMRSLVRTMARNQHDENLPEANREVVDKIVVRACREVDQQSESQFLEMTQRIRGKVWTPLVKLGLEPTAVAMETTADVATVRLRLAATGQLAAHTPRPRGPDDAMFAVQLHESSLNNALDRLGLAGRRLALEDLFRLLAEKAGREPNLPDDLPEGVAVTFAASQPLRVVFRDGLVHLRMALDAIESGRRDWYDVVVQVSYRPRSGDLQVYLDREGPVQLSGPGHQGRIEIALRTIFGKVFPKERPLTLFPPQVTTHPKLAGMPVSHLAATDGWLAIALSAPPANPAPVTAALPAAADKPARRPLTR